MNPKHLAWRGMMGLHAIVLLFGVSYCVLASGCGEFSNVLGNWTISMPVEVSLPSPDDPPARSGWDYGPLYDRVIPNAVALEFERSAGVRDSTNPREIEADDPALEQKINRIFKEKGLLSVSDASLGYPEEPDYLKHKFRCDFPEGADVGAMIRMFRAIPEVTKAYQPPDISGTGIGSGTYFGGTRSGGNSGAP